MRYTRKDVSELLETVNGSPDVQGFATSNFGSSAWTLVSSFGGGSIWQNNMNQRTCEDGGQVMTEDRGSFGC